MNASALVQKLWNYCNVLRDDGMSYGDYVEQLTYEGLLEKGTPWGSAGANYDVGRYLAVAQ